MDNIYAEYTHFYESGKMGIVGASTPRSLCVADNDLLARVGDEIVELSGLASAYRETDTTIDAYTITTSRYYFYSSSFSQLTVAETKEIAKEEVRDNVEFCVFLKFGSFEKVKAIYSYERLNTLMFTILLDTERHDKNLMENLFKIEFLILNKFKDVLIDFNYLPILNDKKDEFINLNYKLILDKDAFSETSFKSGSAQREVRRDTEAKPTVQGLVDYYSFLCRGSLRGVRISK